MELRLEHSSESQSPAQRKVAANPILSQHYEYMELDNVDQITAMTRNNENKQK